jgi:hypothetical protein
MWNKLVSKRLNVWISHEQTPIRENSPTVMIADWPSIGEAPGLEDPLCEIKTG